MYHYIYKTELGDRYYVGRHSTKKIDDNYFGSGKWIRSLKDKSQLKRTIIKMCETFEELIMEEAKIITENLGKPGCMNFNNMPVGFASGELNPAKTAEERARRSLRYTGDNNPSKRPEVRAKKSAAQKGVSRSGYVMSEQGKRNISEGRKGIKFSEQGRKKLSDSRRKEYENGKIIPMSRTGILWTEEEKAKLSKIALERPKLQCPHCGGVFQLSNAKGYHFDKCKHKPV